MNIYTIYSWDDHDHYYYLLLPLSCLQLLIRDRPIISLLLRLFLPTYTQTREGGGVPLPCPALHCTDGTMLTCVVVVGYTGTTPPPDASPRNTETEKSLGLGTVIW